MNGTSVQQEQSHKANYQSGQIGKARRAVLELALQLDYPLILYCDGDRVLHWAEHYPHELVQVSADITHHDFTVIGRTPRAFASHPRNQRDTEAIVNHVFAQVSGHAWDVTAAARGLSRHAAQAILEACCDDEISTDVTWPLCHQHQTHLSQGYIEAEGLEFETADRFTDLVGQAGSLAAWRNQLDGDPLQWVHRLNLARIEIEAMIQFTQAMA